MLRITQMTHPHRKQASLSPSVWIGPVESPSRSTDIISEIEKSIREFGHQHADLTQIAETAVQMRKDLDGLAGQPHKNYRVCVRDV